jgi:hypothetical protein
MLNDFYYKLDEIYNKLDEESKKEFQNILELFVEIMENKTSRNELKKYFNKKLYRDEIRDMKELDITQLRNYIMHNRQIPRKYYNEIEKMIWRLLPELDTFKNSIELYNFLAYIFGIEIKVKGHELTQDKKKLVKIYKQLFDSMERNEKVDLLDELTMRIFAEASSDELNKFYLDKRKP